MAQKKTASGKPMSKSEIVSGMRQTIRYVFLFGLLCFLLSGCFAERRREVREKAVDLMTKVELLQQRVDAQERRIDKLEDQVAELNKRR